MIEELYNRWKELEEITTKLHNEQESLLDEGRHLDLHLNKLQLNSRLDEQDKVIKEIVEKLNDKVYKLANSNFIYVSYHNNYPSIIETGEYRD